MLTKTEFEKDLENLRRLWDSGWIKDLQGAHYWLASDEHPILCDLAFHMLPVLAPIRLEDIAERLPEWRKSKGREELLELAYYGRGSDLDRLMRDSSWQVRCAVVFRKREKDLDILVKDHDVRVREAVAEQRRDKDLDILVKDPDWSVREAVAEAGRDSDLDILVHDKDPWVRREVARYGRPKDLDILKDDPHWAVQEMMW